MPTVKAVPPTGSEILTVAMTTVGLLSSVPPSMVMLLAEVQNLVRLS